jgi:hypothetical protein
VPLLLFLHRNTTTALHTVQRSSDSSIPNLPASKATGVLPEVIAYGYAIEI